ncbi:hypothetical protein E5161_16670 [Cohnella pontilimi]|uniref:Zinc ribbon domain-containing protein n=1 Tax=Cohnella pontilimi TaxID=2564100 RepID=A0A4U0F7S8_9BACL|nr:hypothetical protein [Cohnella pontilimi]TJY40777.1 hypothetical protein E5161_16670 [Cohnella pontilimi]
MSAVAIWGYGITSVVLLFLLVGMFVLIRAMSDPSGRFQEVKEMMDAMFNTPAFLRPNGSEQGAEPTRNEAAAASAMHEPFEDECPACREKVTHENVECPSCGLRLLG